VPSSGLPVFWLKALTSSWERDGVMFLSYGTVLFDDFGRRPLVLDCREIVVLTQYPKRYDH
jgi:hypothetical protein